MPGVNSNFKELFPFSFVSASEPTLYVCLESLSEKGPCNFLFFKVGVFGILRPNKGLEFKLFLITGFFVDVFTLEDDEIWLARFSICNCKNCLNSSMFLEVRSV
ncbi:Pol12p [Saccharomyces cerevisiae AWRI796]|uniref:ORF YBL0414 n=2 Tax=Saccharomyces cerevisiae TaxID=4932 RepID=E9PA37_YEASX|nr:hypothetical protein AWRI1631_20660 [Saccharomyces cerevisiae AWRI1631]EGA76116.1 Pol12p [Saccharomyces cerevisiae AWRI796]EGA84088.1 Pol12p [Saccharomyces cerevisiae Lalvin QA23]EGA88059.1 Pol12p [Saccharomyces cerevisiae VL3]CAA52762.1 unnamed protein product [Saccharomyces cerevisiae]